jgi:phosphopantothenoylcysteine decarboxylase/phosphopantothenate--cysteine ligase
VVLGVTGSIAAYKAVSLLRALTRAGASVSVVMTQAATRFVTPLTFEVLSGGRVTLDLFETHEEMRHLSVPSGADVIVVAPATANCLAKAAVGLADDVLSTMLLAARCPLVLAPAMDGDMWRHPTVVAHTAALRERGALVLDPEVGPLASGHVGQGRLADETRVLKAIETALIPVSDWRGQCVLISAGPTQEAIDPVRFISNRSSGKMGYAVAEAARDRGAEIVLVSGPTALDPPRGITLVRVTTADEMANALRDHFSWATVVIMAAAVADYRPKEPASQKIKKRTRTEWSLELETSTDILAMLSARRTTQILVGFAAETEHLITRAAEKLAAKGLDLIVANNVARPEAGFGSDQNAAVILARDGRQEEFGLMPKRLLADKILTSILEFRRAQQTNRASLTSE